MFVVVVLEATDRNRPFFKSPSNDIGGLKAAVRRKALQFLYTKQSRPARVLNTGLHTRKSAMTLPQNTFFFLSSR